MSERWLAQSSCNTSCRGAWCCCWRGICCCKVSFARSRVDKWNWLRVFQHKKSQRASRWAIKIEKLWAAETSWYFLKFHKYMCDKSGCLSDLQATHTQLILKLCAQLSSAAGSSTSPEEWQRVWSLRSERCQSFSRLSLWEEETPFHSKRICEDSRSIRWKHHTDHFKEDERERTERIQGSKMKKRCRETDWLPGDNQKTQDPHMHPHFQLVFRNSSFKTVQPTHWQTVKHPATWECS